MDNRTTSCTVLHCTARRRTSGGGKVDQAVKSPGNVDMLVSLCLFIYLVAHSGWAAATPPPRSRRPAPSFSPLRKQQHSYIPNCIYKKIEGSFKVISLSDEKMIGLSFCGADFTTQLIMTHYAPFVPNFNPNSI